jgi:hypothetical protein
MRLNIKNTRVFEKAAKEAEMLYYKEIFDNKTNSIKQLWRNINTIWALKKSRMTATIIKHLKVNNAEITCPNDICSAFNTYFSSIGQKLRKVTITDNDRVCILHE